MNRADFLEKTLPTWVKHPFDKIIIVDWSSTDHIEDVIEDNQDGRIYRLRVMNRSEFHRTKSINIGVNFLNSKWIAHVDSDVMIHDKFLDMDRTNENVFYHFPSGGAWGTCIFSKKAFLDVGGYNENLIYYGQEDDNFYCRLEAKGYEIKYLNLSEKAYHINHGDNRRFQYQTQDYNRLTDADRVNRQNDKWNGKMQPINVRISNPNGMEEFKIIGPNA